MATTTLKILGYTLAAGALVLLARQVSGISHLAAALQTLQRISFEGNTLKVYITFRNPTNGTITVKHPVVSITYKDTLLVSSPPVDKDYPIKPYADTTLDPITFQLNPAAVTAVPGMLMEAAAGKVTLVSMVTTTLNNTFPKTDKKEMVWNLPLKKPNLRLALKT